MRRGTGLAVAAAAAALVAACGGKDSCPTAAANAENQNMASACSSPAPQQVAIRLNLCEACSHTDPTCSPDLHAAGTGDIFLDTKWEVCTDNSSCAVNACATVTCSFSVPNGTYQVHTIDKTGTPASFMLTATSGSATCSGSI
jgi:major membrane immunogen (membrane-anchored lipoprotein)